MAHWKCLNEGCTDDHVYNFKGLCRSCTVYGDDGSVQEPFQRSRVNRDGSTYHKHTVQYIPKPITRREKMSMDREYSQQRKMNTKIRKARQIMREEGIDMDAKDLESFEIGESVDDSEEE